MNSEAPKSPPSVCLLFKHLALLFGLSIVVLTLIFLLTEGIVVRKILTSLVLPAGCCWIGLILLTYFTLVFRRWWAGISSLLLTGIYTLSASPIVGGYLARPLEEPYRDFSIDRAENFDVLILLGGGTDFGFNRQPELGSSGDRVMVALQMYRAGKTKKIVCTGSLIESLAYDGRPSPGEASRQILIRAGVPAPVIELSEGRTTSEEMAHLAKKFDGKSSKIGIVTSAWHLPRALRLAAKNELQAKPVPADFASGAGPINIMTFLPSAGSMNNNTRLLKEHLARIIGQ